eukprot:Sspe_Gene.80441::Locus_50807_Transcript_1_1_Confidence_1.000_Length_2804::g.80441::m.80441/K06994/K06994; putative drug exporter of the RND superfamily
MGDEPFRDESQVAMEPTWVRGYVRLLRSRWGYVIAAVWIATLGVSAFFAPKFIKATSQDFEAPSDSAATKARNRLVEYFPEFQQSADLVLFVTCNNDGNVIDGCGDGEGCLANFTTGSFQQLVEGYKAGFMQSYVGYYTLKNISGLAAKAFVSEDYTATFISMRIATQMTSTQATDFAKWAKNTAVPRAQDQAGCGDKYTMTLMGAPAFLDVMIKSSTEDLERMDAIVLPIALLVLASILKSLRLMILPVLCLGCSAATSFAIMYGVAQQMEVFAASPSLMMSILIAMSIDYGLFLLSRYREELLKQKSLGLQDTFSAVAIMLESAGHTISVSGVTLAGCFFGLILFQNSVMKSLGIGCGVVLLCVLITNLTVTPLMLVLFSDFFQKCIEPARFWPPRCPQFRKDEPLNAKRKDSDSSPSVGFSEVDTRTRPTNCNSEEHEPLIKASRSVMDPKWEAGDDIVLTEKKEDQEIDKSSVWYKLGSKAVKFPNNVLVVLVIVGLTLPFDLKAVGYTITDSNVNYLPSDSPVTKAFIRMGDTFGYGQMFSYSILVRPTDRSAGIGDALDGSCNYINALVGNLTHVNESDFQSAAWGLGQCTSQFAKACIESSSCNTTEDDPCHAIMLGACAFINNVQHPNLSTAVWVRFTPSFAPMSSEGRDWLRQARKIQIAGLETRIAGQSADAIDAMDALNDEFPTMIGVTISVVLVFVAVAFRSIFIPLRSVLTIALTVAWVYGFGVRTYQYGDLEWMHFSGFKSTHAMVYIIPLMSFSIVVGIGLDYDIFLVTRIVEYRRLGYSTPDAIVYGMTQTGYIITAAGVIMAIAFSGLLFSQEPFMHQLSFFMVFAVLFDTFVVRSVLVPACMGILGEWNWWPFTLRDPCAGSSQPLETDGE